MKIILIIAICLVVIATIIVILGILTHWTFKCKKKDNYEQLSEISIIKQRYDECAKTVFNIMNSLGYEWWPTEGTLIGILRYGENFALSNFSFSPIGTDTDIDIMIRVDNDLEWDKLKKDLQEKFKKALWKNFYTSKDGNVPKGSKFVCKSKYNIGIDNIHTDIHRYIVDEKSNTVYTTKSNQLKYPFQYWKNKIKYRGNLVDSNGKLGVALYQDMPVPCPLNAISLLSHWNRDEYSASDIRWPKGGVQKQGDKFIFSNANFNITEDDKKKLRKLWAKLHKQGYMSFTENKELPYKRWQVERYENSKFLLTIVTAYIEIPSKHSKKEYKKWIKNLLTYSGPMVIFVDSKNIKYITDLRKGLPTAIIPTELEDLSTNKYRGKFNHKLGWYYQTNMLNKNLKDMDMYSTLILEKPNFLKRAVKLNSFNTPYYMWFDIGYLRNNQKIPSSFPNKNKLKILSSKIFLMALNNNLCDIKSDNKAPYTYDKPPYNVLITGGIMGYNKNNIDKFHYLFYNKLENIIKEKKEWAGMEQFILSKIYCENPDLFHVIKAQPHPFVNNDPWFYGIPYFM